jgi:hypothetical protein
MQNQKKLKGLALKSLMESIYFQKSRKLNNGKILVVLK